MVMASNSNSTKIIASHRNVVVPRCAPLLRRRRGIPRREQEPRLIATIVSAVDAIAGNEPRGSRAAQGNGDRRYYILNEDRLQFGYCELQWVWGLMEPYAICAEYMLYLDNFTDFSTRFLMCRAGALVISSIICRRRLSSDLAQTLRVWK